MVLVVVIGATSISENWRSFGGRVQRRPSPFPCFRAPLFDPLSWYFPKSGKKSFRNVLVRHFLPSLGFYVQIFCVTTSMLLFSPLSFALVKYFPTISRCAHRKKGKNLSFHNFPRIMHKWCWVAYLQLYLLEIFESGQKILSSQEVLKEEFSKYLSSARAWQSWRPLKTRWQIWASIIISCHSWMRFNLLSVMHRVEIAEIDSYTFFAKI